MTLEFDMEISRLIDEKTEPDQSELFVERVYGRIAQRRRAHRAIVVLLAITGGAILAALTPSLINLKGYIVYGTSVFALSAALFLLSPVGYPVGFGLGLFAYLKTRL